jgi:hypothetical protein
MMKSLLAGVALSAVMVLGAVSDAAAQARTKVTAYTALENDQLGPFKTAIEAAVPDVEIVWVRDSTGVITARFLAEKDNPRADIVLALAATSLLLFEKQGLLETYEPVGAQTLKPQFRDPTAPYTWTGSDAFLAVLCRGRQGQGGRAHVLAGSRQARVQGQDRDAASGIFRYGLSPGRSLAADHGRGCWLGLHGQAA